MQLVNKIVDNFYIYHTTQTRGIKFDGVDDLAFELLSNLQTNDERETEKFESIRRFIQRPLEPDQFSCNILWLLTLNPDRPECYYDILAEIYRRFYIPGNPVGYLMNKQPLLLLSYPR